jgi:hypothetical protein
MTTYFFTFLAAPTEDAQEYEQAGGAYVNCWIRSDSRDQAEARAAALIEEYGWDVEALEEQSTVTSADYDQDDEDRQFYEQALVEGEVLVFNTWPVGDGEDGDDELT